MALDLTGFRRLQAERSRLTLAHALREWATIGEDFDAGWARVGPRMTLLVTAAQLGAAKAAVSFIGDNVDVEPTSVVKPSGLAGLASDGRTLETLLYGAVVKARTAQSTSLTDRLQAGAFFLSRAVPTQVADAGRDAARLAVVSRPHVAMVRLASAPCCQRCAVLAGRVYRWSQGFKRHPRCDCQMLPQTVVAPDAPGREIHPDDIHDLTALQRKAIADGHDMTKVINDYNRKGAWHMPPTRVEQIIDANAWKREAAEAALQQKGLLDSLFKKLQQ